MDASTKQLDHAATKKQPMNRYSNNNSNGNQALVPKIYRATKEFNYFPSQVINFCGLLVIAQKPSKDFLFHALKTRLSIEKMDANPEPDRAQVGSIKGKTARA